MRHELGLAFGHAAVRSRVKASCFSSLASGAVRDASRLILEGSRVAQICVSDVPQKNLLDEMVVAWSLAD